MSTVSRKREKPNNYSGIDKQFYKTLLKDLFFDTCRVVFWDGEKVYYGPGESKFTLIMNESISKADIIADPSLAFSKAYMHKKLK